MTSESPHELPICSTKGHCCRLWVLALRSRASSALRHGPVQPQRGRPKGFAADRRFPDICLTSSARQAFAGCPLHAGSGKGSSLQLTATISCGGLLTLTALGGHGVAPLGSWHHFGLGHRFGVPSLFEGPVTISGSRHYLRVPSPFRGPVTI